MFVGEVRSLHKRGALERCFTLVGSDLLLDCTEFSEANTLAYYEHSKITVVKSFITFGPGVVKIFFFVAHVPAK
jgi:hypothetical protein